MVTPAISLELADGHVLGNFQAYYSFNPAHERLRFMDATTRDALSRALLATDKADDTAPATVLDVGCNEGDLTIRLFKHLIGELGDAGTPVDLVSFDGSSVSTLNEMIQKNKQKFEYIITEEGGSEHRRHFVCELRIDGELAARSQGISKKVAKAKAATEALQCIEQKDTSGTWCSFKTRTPTICVPTTQPLQLSNRRRLCVLGVDVDEGLIQRATKKAIADGPKHSDTVAFARADAMERSFGDVANGFLAEVGCKQRDQHTTSGGQKRRSFSLVTLFSVTMWIHLNHGDDGLWKFLEAVSDMADHLIVEPQPWKCYRNAINRLSRSRATIPPSFSSLKVGEGIIEEIDKFLLDAGRFHCKAQLGKTNWSRPIRLCSRKPIAGVEYTPR